MATPDLDTELAALSAMPLAALRQRWSDLTGAGGVSLMRNVLCRSKVPLPAQPLRP